MQTFEKRQGRKKLFYLADLPERIQAREGKPSILVFAQKKGVLSACLRCVEPFCMQSDNLSPVDLDIDFSADLSTTLCPVNAIYRDNTNKAIIKKEACIGCGLCAARCPVGAIYFSSSKKSFVVSHKKSDFLISKGNTPDTREKQVEQLKALKELDKEGSLLQETDLLLMNLQEKLKELSPLVQNKFVKNVLRAIHCWSFVRRIGDNSFRMDGLISFRKHQLAGPLEIEFGDDCLSAVRLMLDDISVLHSRYGLDKNKQEPLVVFHHMPNIRQGFWQVCHDINEVTGIRIKTLTVIALLLLMWNNKKLRDSFELYYLDSAQHNLVPFLEKALGRKLKIKESASGILSPVK